MIGKKAPRFNTRNILGEKFSSKKMLEENNIIVLNFWFTTCGTCQSEIPKLNQLKNSYREDPNVKFIAIALDDKTRLIPFLRKKRLFYDIVDEGRWLAQRFDITSYPTNIIIDKNGLIQFYETGYRSDIKNQMVNVIDRLLED